jgi:ubiquinone/menaquinone biosynthesis C-methylase UbiE
VSGQGHHPGHPVAAGKSSFDLVEPEKVFAELRLTPDMVLLDVACGSGNYTLAAAAYIGPRGAIHAVDLWAGGIARLREEAARRRLAQVHAAVADVSHLIPLRDASVDVALMATVLHDLVEVGTAQGALREVARVLRPGGRLVLVEFDKVDGPPGPPRAIRLAPEEAAALLAPYGFTAGTPVRVGPHTYLLDCSKA